MESLFKNTYVRNKQLTKEYFGFLFFKRIFFIVCDAILGLCFVRALFLSIYYWEFLNLNLILPPLAFAFQAFMYYFYSTVQVKRNLEIHGKEPTIELTVTNEVIHHAIVGCAEFTLDFSKIKRAFCTKNYIFLLTKAGNVCALNKVGFSIGSEAEFIEFLESKGIRVRKHIEPKIASKILSFLPIAAYTLIFALYYLLATFGDNLGDIVWYLLYILFRFAEIGAIFGPVLSIRGLYYSIRYRKEDRKKGTVHMIVSIISIIIGIAFAVIYFARFAEVTYSLGNFIF